MEKARRDRLEALLGIGLGVAGLALLGYFLSRYALGQTPARTLAPAGPTAVLSTPTRVAIDLWDACGRARAAAEAEAPDAELVSASTQWQSESEDAILTGASDWTFVFYSAEKSSELDVVVTSGSTGVINQTQVWKAPTSLDEGAWKAGPRDAQLVFLAYGGRRFLDEHPEALVNVHLGQSEASGAAWSIAALDAEERTVFSVVIDAGTLEVLSSGP